MTYAQLNPTNRPPAIAARGISKAFGPTQALAGVDLVVGRGEVVALMGANGAGKSTLVKILAGSLDRDAGVVEIAGRTIELASPGAARAASIATVHQATDLAGAAGLTVAENLILDDLCGGRGPLLATPGGIRRRARAVAARLDLDLPLDRDFADLRPAERQLVAIARAVAAEASVIMLDEPTSTLSAVEADRLFGIIERLKGEGIAILYISHRLGDLARLADRAVVLRGGRVVGEFARPLDLSAAVSAMIGRPMESARPVGRDAGAPVLEVRGARLFPTTPAFDLVRGQARWSRSPGRSARARAGSSAPSSGWSAWRRVP